MTQTTLVVGGTGKTGRRVVDGLRELGLPVRVGSRSGEFPFDWADESTWAPALRGVDQVYLSYFPDLADPAAPAAITAVTEAAKANGVSKLVLLSGRGEEAAQVCEGIVQASGLDWTILRASWFSQNFSEGYLLDPVLSGAVYLPAGDIPEPFIDVDDIAEVAIAALASSDHVGKLYELTGPESLTFAEAIATIAAASGRPVTYTQIPVEDFAAAMREEGVPAEVVDLLVYLFTTVQDGRNAKPSNGVQSALGRPARTFAEYAKATAGAWSA